jgi:hypothetical protein
VRSCFDRRILQRHIRCSYHAPYPTSRAYRTESSARLTTYTTTTNEDISKRHKRCPGYLHKVALFVARPTDLLAGACFKYCGAGDTEEATWSYTMPLYIDSGRLFALECCGFILYACTGRMQTVAVILNDDMGFVKAVYMVAMSVPFGWHLF